MDRIELFESVNQNSSNWRLVVEEGDKENTCSSNDIFRIRQRCMYLVIALHKFVNEEQTGMRWTWKKCIMHSMSEMNDVVVEVYTNWQPLQRWHRRIVNRFNNTFLKAPSAKQLMPPFFREHPDAMDAFKRYGVVHLKELSIELMHSYVHDSLIPATMKSLGQAFDEDTTSNNNLEKNSVTAATKESYLRRYGSKCISLSTIVRWMHACCWIQVPKQSQTLFCRWS